MSIFDRIQKAFQAGAEAFQTEGSVGDEGKDVDFEDLRKAMEAKGLAQPTEEKPRGMFHDPYSFLDWGGWREQPSSLTYETLRQMSIKTTPITAIIALRTNQVSQFARPQQNRYDRGYRVMLRDRRDRKRSMTDEEAKQAAEIERMLETTGFLLPDEKPHDRDSFRTFIKKWVRDQLTYDQFCFEIIRDRIGRVSRFIALPSETIRPAVIDSEHLDAKDRRERVSHVQIFENTVIAEWGPDSIAWCVMNPRTDLRVNSFGFSPLEQLINLVTAWLYGFEFNQRAFTNGSNVKGIINIKGAIPDRQLRAFRRMWYSMVTGIQNSWRTPILNSEELQFINMHQSAKEMEYSAWMDWLTKLVCAVYGVDPVEINFQFGNTGQKSALNEGSMEYKFAESKDKGLRPLIDHIQDCINLHLVWDINPDFEFVFSGLDAKAEEKEREAHTKEVKFFRTVNEIRAERDEEPLPDGKGDVILDTVWMQNAQAAGPGPAMDQVGDDGPWGGMHEMPGSEEDQDDLAAFKSNTAEDSLKKAFEVLHEAEGTIVRSRQRGNMLDMIIDLPDD